MNTRSPIGFFSHYARETAKLDLSRQMYKESKLDFWSIPGCKGIFVGDGYIGIALAEEHPAQGQLIPTELKSPDFKGVPVITEYHGFTYHLMGKLDSIDDARPDAYFAYQGRRGGGGGGGAGGVQGGTQIVCANKEYGTCTGIFVNSSNTQNGCVSWHVLKACGGQAPQKGSGNKNQPQGAGALGKIIKSGCGCGGGSGVSSKGWAELGYYGLGAPLNYDYASAYPAIFGREIDDIPYIGRRPLDHNFYQRGGGSRGGGGGGRGNFYLDLGNFGVTNGQETILGLGKPKGIRRAVMKEKLSFRGVYSGSTKTFPVTGLNYTDRGGICGTST